MTQKNKIHRRRRHSILTWISSAAILSSTSSAGGAKGVMGYSSHTSATATTPSRTSLVSSSGWMSRPTRLNFRNGYDQPIEGASQDNLFLYWMNLAAVPAELASELTRMEALKLDAAVSEEDRTVILTAAREFSFEFDHPYHVLDDCIAFLNSCEELDSTGYKAAVLYYYGREEEVFENRSLQNIFPDDAVQIARECRYMQSMHEGDLNAGPSLKVLSQFDWRSIVIRGHECLMHIHFQDIDNKTDTSRLMAKQALDVLAPMAARAGMYRLKTDLEDVSFRYLYPLSYTRVVQYICHDKKSHEAVLEEAVRSLKTAVMEDCSLLEKVASIEVSSRIKSPYSTWKKLCQLGRIPTSTDTIRDTIGVRLILSGADSTCYDALDLVKAIFWGKLKKDYISKPKANGYQSLHYDANTRYHGRQYDFEVQIRTSEMHQVAEFGAAAHWRYKMGGVAKHA